MSWRTFLGLRPTLETFARDLIDHARRVGRPDWRYDVNECALMDGRDPAHRVNLANLFLEYSGAHRKVRPALIHKYLALLTSSSVIRCEPSISHARMTIRKPLSNASTNALARPYS